MMEKRVVPSANRRPVSRGSDSTFSPPSSSSSPFSSSPSSSLSGRTLEVLPPDPIPFSVLSRPSSSSSRPHSPSTSSARSNSSSTSRPHSPSQSPLGSPSTKRRGTPSQNSSQDGLFLTSLRNSNSGHNSIGYVDFDDSKSDQSEDLLQANDSISNENVRHANANGANEINKQDAEEERASVEAEQAARRAELDVYMHELKKKEVVVFPPNFTELLETIEADQIEAQTFWAKYMLDQQIDNPWLEDEQLAKGLERIRKLDIILAKKTKQYREIKKAREPPKPPPENLEPSPKEKGKHIPAPPQLTQMDEKRLEALLDDEQPEIRSIPTPFEELDTLFDIDAKLAEIIDVSEWDAKGLAHLRPTSASSRASFTSYISQSSISSYSSFLSFASRASRGSQVSKELEKQLEEEEKAAKARLEEIDAKLRELANAEAAIINCNTSEAEIVVEKAPPEEIRRLVRMYSNTPNGTPRSLS